MKTSLCLCLLLLSLLIAGTVGILKFAFPKPANPYVSNVGYPSFGGAPTPDPDICSGAGPACIPPPLR